MKSPKKLILLAGIIIFIFILSSVNLEKVVGILSMTRPDLFLAAIFLLGILLLLKGVKWKLILSSQKKTISTLKSAKYFCIGFFFSSFTPGRLGDFIRAFYIRNMASLPLAISSVVLDRVLDVGLLLFFASLSSFYFLQVNGFSIIPIEWLAVLLAVLAIGVFLLFKEKYLKMILRPMFNILVPHNLKETVSVGFQDFFSSSKLIFQNKAPFAGATVISVVFWLLEFFFANLIALSIGIDIGFVAMVFVYPLVVLGDMIPVSVAGIGTREAILIFLFSFFSLAPEQAVAFSLLMFFTSYVLVAIIGFVFFLSEPVDLKLFSDKGK